MAKHDQRSTSGPVPFVCTECSNGFCGACIDKQRSIYTTVMLCKCKRADHREEVA